MVDLEPTGNVGALGVVPKQAPRELRRSLRLEWGPDVGAGGGGSGGSELLPLPWRLRVLVLVASL